MFKDSERRIFPYNDGTADRFGDPLELEREIRLALGDPNQVITQIRAIYDPNAPIEAVLSGHIVAKKAAAAIRQIFGLAPVDPVTGNGVTEAMVWHTWRSFHQFLREKKTDTEP